MKAYELTWSQIREQITTKNEADYNFEKFLHHFIVVNYEPQVKKARYFPGGNCEAIRGIRPLIQQKC